MPADDYRDFARKLAPRGLWLRDAVSQSYLGGIGGFVEGNIGIWRETAKMRFALHAPDDALPMIGDARQLERAPRETVEAYRARLRRSFEIHGDRTSPDAYRHALEPLGVAPTDVFPWSWFEAGIGAWWSTVWIVVDATGGTPWGPAYECDAGLFCDTGILCDVSGLNVDEVGFLRRTIRRWKLASAFPVGLWIVLSGQCCDMGLFCDAGLECDDGDDATAIIPLGKVTEQENLLWGAGPPLCDSGLFCDGVFY